VPIVERDAPAKLNTMIAAGDLPDIVTANYPVIQQYGPDGLFVNYRDAAPTKLPNLMARFEQFPEVRDALPATNGGWYVLPQINSETFQAESVLAVRSDLLSQLGINKQSLTTLPALLDYLKRKDVARYSALIAKLGLRR